MALIDSTDLTSYLPISVMDPSGLCDREMELLTTSAVWNFARNPPSVSFAKPTAPARSSSLRTRPIVDSGDSTKVLYSSSPLFLLYSWPMMNVRLLSTVDPVIIPLPVVRRGVMFVVVGLSALAGKS